MTPILVRLGLRAATYCAGVLLVIVGFGSQRPGPSVRAPGRTSAGPEIGIIPDLGQASSPRVVEHVGAVERVILGSLRAEVASGEAALADDRFAFAITSAVPTAHGWLFIAADGTVARSTSFLGPLERFGAVPRPDPDIKVQPLSPSCGRLAIGVVDPPRASLWTTDGNGPIAPAPGAPPGIVLAAAFLDAAHGMIVLDGGELFFTRNGAASFERIDLGEAAASDVACVRGELHVATSHGALRFPQDVLWSPRDALRGFPVTEDAAPSTEPLRTPILVAALRRYGALVADAFDAVVADDGRVLVPHGHALVPVADASTAELAAAISWRPCSARRWGDHYALLCYDGLFRVDGRTLQAVQLSSEPSDMLHLGSVLPSPDGVHLLARCPRRLGWPGACMMQPGEPLPIREGAVEIVDGRERYTSDTSAPTGSRGDAAVELRWRRNAFAVALKDPRTNHVLRDIAVPLPPGTERFNDLNLALTGDGEAVIGAVCDIGAAYCEPAHWAMRVGLSDGQVTAIALPAGASRVGFVSPARGVAVGRDLATLWITDDGGAHWQPRDTGGGGALQMPRELWGRDVIEDGIGAVRCDAQRCTIDRRVTVSFAASAWSAGRPARDRVLASPAPAREAPRWQKLELRSVPVAVGRQRNDATTRSTEYALEEDGRTQFWRENVAASLQVTPDGEWRLDWRGFDWQGAYRTRHSSGKLALPVAGEYYLDRTTREGAVMMYLGQPSRLIWLPAGRPPVEIADDMLYSGDGQPRFEDLLTLPDGTLAVLVQSLPVRELTAYHRLLHIDREGEVIEQRTLYWDDEWRSNSKDARIAVVDGALGVEWAPRDLRFPRWFFAIDATRSRHAVATDPTTAPLCRPGARGPLTIAASWGEERRFFLRGGRAGAPMCEQAAEISGGSTTPVFAVVSSHGDERSAMAYGEVRAYRWAKASDEDRKRSYCACTHGRL